VRLALGLMAAVGACSGLEHGTTPHTEAAIWLTRGSGGLTAIDPGTSDQELLDAAACQACHAAEHAEWRQSRHGQAWVNGIFQREYRVLPRVGCVNCHAPLGPQVAEVAAGGGALANQGVSCAACHVRKGAIVARRMASNSPHRTIVDGDFGSPAFCADCHEFAFPILRDDQAVAMSRHPMQTTVSEFRRGPFANQTGGCRSCHADSPARHRYPGGHDLEMLQSALSVELCRDDAALSITTRNQGAGHHVPTGDVHRHLVVRAWKASAPEALFEIFFGRRYVPDREGGKRTVWDSTLAPQQAKRFSVAFDALGGAPDETITLEAVYVYTEDETPSPRRHPGEDTKAVVWETEILPNQLRPCASR
jgi:hypothetical protein